ncbi:PadR family transcriptional regulator [Actinocorallia sp. API 0066]|nr:PadR family transcriptional regulator [Actinocorallia sp. API 0066]
MYPILMRLAERGLVETAWETSPPRGRPARHLYRLTAAGGELAATAAAEAAEAERDRAAGSRPARLAPGTA